jgi:hypothetical protein
MFHPKHKFILCYYDFLLEKNKIFCQSCRNILSRNDKERKITNKREKLKIIHNGKNNYNKKIINLNKELNESSKISKIDFDQQRIKEKILSGNIQILE